MSDDSPMVTALIPSYNTPEEYLQECLLSLAEQTVADWEAVVVEDGPGKRDVEGIVRDLRDPRVRFIRHERNRGIGAARNTAFRTARADIVLTLDADDKLLPRFLERMLQTLKEDPTANCVLVDFQEFGAGRDLLEIPDPLPPPCPQHPVFTDTGVLLRRGLWETVGGYTEDPSLRGAEWWDFWIRAVQAGLHAAHLAEPLYMYRRHSAAASVTTSMYDDHRNREALYRRHKDLFDASLRGGCPRCGPHPHVRAFRAQGYVVSSRAALSRGERLRAIGLALRGFLLHPWGAHPVRQMVRSFLPNAAARTIGRALDARGAEGDRPR